jgi:hypothetical protein
LKKAISFLKLLKNHKKQDWYINGFEKRFTWRGRQGRFGKRGENERMGLFGGGWDRCLGIRMGKEGFKGTIYMELWIFEFRLNKRGRY